MKEVSLVEMLDAREKRAFTQKILLEKYKCSLVFFTMNIAGPIKNSPLIKKAFEVGKNNLEKSFLRNKINCIYFDEISENTGNEAYYVIDDNPLTIKKLTCAVEESSSLARLFDIDVIDFRGNKIDRKDIGLETRKCLICSNDAKACGRNRTHSVEELQKETRKILAEYFEGKNL